MDEKGQNSPIGEWVETCAEALIALNPCLMRRNVGMLDGMTFFT